MHLNINVGISLLRVLDTILLALLPTRTFTSIHFLYEIFGIVRTDETLQYGVDNLAKKLLIIIWCCWDSETMNPGKLYWNISTLYVRGYIDRGTISVQNLYVIMWNDKTCMDFAMLNMHQPPHSLNFKPHDFSILMQTKSHKPRRND